MREAAVGCTPMLPFGETEDALRDRIRALEAERDRLAEDVFHLQRVTQTGLMTSGMAHDLANQVTAVLGNAELALMKAHPEALREGLRSVLEHGRRIHDTVDAFLSFVRRREHRVRTLAVRDLVDSVQRLMEPLARGESVSCIGACTTEASVSGDRQLLEQALVNLVLNAIRAASSTGGRVVLTASDAGGGRVRLSVRDTGPGIPEDVRRRLFQPFSSGHVAEGGTGLGLYIVRQVVERSRGRLHVESSSAGTRIDIDLPVVAGLPASPSPDLCGAR